MRPSARCLALAVAATFTAACTNLGPDYQEPEVAWLAEWETDLYGRKDVGVLELRRGERSLTPRADVELAGGGRSTIRFSTN